MRKVLITIALIVLVASMIGYLAVNNSKDDSLKPALSPGIEKTIREEALKTYTEEEVDTHCIDSINDSKVTKVLLVNYSSCSTNLPNYCKDGKLVSDCKRCGCESLEECNLDGTCAFDEIMGGAGGASAIEESEEGSAGAGGAAAPDSGSGNDEDNITLIQNQTEEQNITQPDNNQTNITETCVDEILNQDETDIDCGGICGGYWYNDICNMNPQATCNDGIQNQGETGIDCSGPCASCDEEGGQGESETCYVEPTDSQGLTIFAFATCHDPNGEYTNTCTSPVGGGDSATYIKTYVCVNNYCSPKYYSCPIKGQEFFGTPDYHCSAGVCTT